MHGGKPGDKHVNKEDNTGGLPGHASRSMPVAEDTREAVPPMRYAFRSFDRQYLIPDKRLINQANPALWAAHSDRQVYLTAPTDKSPTSGPALSFTALIPDAHHYNGRGGRVFPLWQDAGATAPNVNPNLLAALASAYGQPVSAEDVMAYLAAVAAHPAYVERFADDLVQPGLPLTANADLWAEAVTLGREVVWLHTFGERFADAAAGRPPGPPRAEARPTIPDGASIPTDADELHYNSDEQRLYVGTGYVEHVPPEVWAYEVSDKQVLTQWFSYRRRDRSRPLIGNRRPPSALNAIQPEGWLPEYTTELLNVLARLVAVEPAQATLLQTLRRPHARRRHPPRRRCLRRAREPRTSAPPQRPRPDEPALSRPMPSRTHPCHPEPACHPELVSGSRTRSLPAGKQVQDDRGRR